MSQRRHEPIVRDGPYRTAPILAFAAVIVLAVAAFFLIGQNVRLPSLPDLAPAFDPQNQQAPPRDEYGAAPAPVLEDPAPTDAPDCGGKPC